MNFLEMHALQLGKLVGNLMSLELLLRCVLAELEPDGPQVGLELKVGDRVPEAAISDYCALGQIIRRYSSAVPSADWIDERLIVDVRDAVAHGRASTVVENTPLTLVKFGKPDKASRTVEVMAVITMDEGWFQANVKAIAVAMEKVYAVARRIGIVSD